jgi:hypothetical protein
MKKTILSMALAFFGIVSILMLTAPPQVRGDNMSEYVVKAGYLVNFGKFVHWPETAFEGDSSPIVIGVLGEDPFNTVLDKAVAGQVFNGRSFKVKRFDNFDKDQANQLRKCHILFIAYSEKDLTGEILKALKGSSTLTVAEFSEFPVMGGMVTFDQVGQRIGLVLNNKAAQKSGLSFSAQLQQVSTIY